jgi:hypothetical protein
MKRLAVATAILAIGTAACGSNSATSPTNPPTVFTVSLTTANETPPVTGAEAGGQGTAVITINTVKDSGGNITSATADFTVTMSGFPAGSTAILAHIHPGAAGVKGSPLVDTGLTAGTGIAMPSGSGTFSRTGIAVTVSDVTSILATPQNYYFNVHTTVNPGGAIRGQLR